MSDTKTYTEREVIERERGAFASGAHLVFQFFGVDPYSKPDWKGSYRHAAERYPLPKVTRPRMVQDGYGNDYKVDAGDLMIRHGDDEEWGFVLHLGGNSSVIQDLLANPTEEVDA